VITGLAALLDRIFRQPEAEQDRHRLALEGREDQGESVQVALFRNVQAANAIAAFQLYQNRFSRGRTYGRLRRIPRHP